jgi:hypothetical protein
MMFFSSHNVSPVVTGVLKQGDPVYNPVKAKRERIGRIVQMHANERQDLDAALVFGSTANEITGSGNSIRSRVMMFFSSHNVSPCLSL